MRNRPRGWRDISEADVHQLQVVLGEEHKRSGDALIFQEMAACWLR